MGRSGATDPHEFAVPANPYVSALKCAICERPWREHRCLECGHPLDDHDLLTGTCPQP